MSYENKYIKYKLKYLKLQQKGGSDQIILWPELYNNIRPNDVLEIVYDKDVESKLKEMGKDENPSQFVNRGKVRYVTRDSIELYNQTNETVYKAKDFIDGIKFRKIDENMEKVQEQIKDLEKKQKQLEDKLNNHYHVLPTSGIKYFEDSHPYYNKKID